MRSPSQNSRRTEIWDLGAAAAGEDGARGAVRAEIVDAVDRQQIGKPRARAVDPALDRADRAAADRRRVLVGEAGRADEDKGLALVWRQLLKRGTKLLELHAAGLLRIGFERVGVAAFGVLHLPPPLAVF